jgi:alpha-tubulin suppressor-like RCC1 family protein
MPRPFLRSLIAICATATLVSCADTTPPEDTWATRPTQVNGTNVFTSLALGDVHSCGLLENGHALCWGLNSQGQSGNGVSGGAGVDIPAPVIGGFTFASLSAGGAHTCGILTSGLTYCWGNGEGGQLGTNSTVARFEPAPITGEHLFTQISSSTAAHTCGIKANGEAWCWGFGQYGRLGNGATTQRNVPTLVSGGLTFTSISAGGGHTCGLVTDGSAYCWGLNSRGQLGDGTFTDRSVPVLVSTTIKFKQVAAGVAHTCALSEQGDPYCWGDNVAGALGDGTFESKAVPTPVEGGFNFNSIVVGERHACGLTPENTALCWGYNNAGALGDGTLITRTTPVTLFSAIAFKSLAAGGYHTCGISVTNQTYCWGDNYGFQLGIPDSD